MTNGELRKNATRASKAGTSNPEPRPAVQCSSIVHRAPEPRHFAWELFSAGPAVERGGKSLHEVPVALSGTWV